MQVLVSVFHLSVPRKTLMGWWFYRVIWYDSRVLVFSFVIKGPLITAFLGRQWSSGSIASSSSYRVTFPYLVGGRRAWKLSTRWMSWTILALIVRILISLGRRPPPPCCPFTPGGEFKSLHRKALAWIVCIGSISWIKAGHSLRWRKLNRNRSFPRTMTEELPRTSFAP